VTIWRLTHSPAVAHIAPSRSYSDAIFSLRVACRVRDAATPTGTEAAAERESSDATTVGECEDACPLLGVELPRASLRSEAERRRKPLDLHACERRPKSQTDWSRACEGVGEKAPVDPVQVERYPWLHAALELEDRAVDARWRRERLPVQVPANRDVVPGSPVGGTKRRGPDGRVFRSELPLHDHVRFLQRQAGIAKQAGEDRSRAGKRQIGDHNERLARPVVLDGVGLNDLDCREVAESGTKPMRKRLIAFDHDDIGPGSGERLGEDARAPADLDDEIAKPEPSFGDEVGCELLTSEEVLAGRFPCGSSPDGHGTSPSSSCRDSRERGATVNARAKSPRLHYIAHLSGPSTST